MHNFTPVFYPISVCGSVAECLGPDLRPGRAGLIPSCPAADCNLWQVVYTHVPLSSSSIIWYHPMVDDALRLRRNHGPGGK